MKKRMKAKISIIVSLILTGSLIIPVNGMGIIDDQQQDKTGSEIIRAGAADILSINDEKITSDLNENATQSYDVTVVDDQTSIDPKNNALTEDSISSFASEHVHEKGSEGGLIVSVDTTWQNDYKYYLDEVDWDGKKRGAIFLQNYKGKATNIIVPSLATINGYDYHTFLVTEAFKDNDTIVSVDLSNLETRGHTDLSQDGYRLFMNCSKLEYVDISNLDIVQANYMFKGCRNLKTIRTEGVSLGFMSGMFEDCSSLKSIDVSSFGNGMAKFHLAPYGDMQGMFKGCTSLTSIDLSAWIIGQDVHMESMFEDCVSLKTAILNETTGDAYCDADSMFKNCIKLETVVFTKPFTILEGQDMFKGCSGLRYVDLTGFKSYWEVYEQYKGFFDGCDSLEEIKTPKEELKKQYVGEWGIQFPNIFWCPEKNSWYYEYLTECPTSVTIKRVTVVENIQLDKYQIDLFRGEEDVIKVTFFPSDAAILKIRSASWESADPNIVTVDKNGRIKGVGKGEAYVYFRFDNAHIPGSREFNIGCKVTVKSKTVKGDVTGDDEVAMGDVVKVAKAVAGSITLTEDEQEAADVTGDNEVAMGDVVKMAQFVAGAITEL